MHSSPSLSLCYYSMNHHMGENFPLNYLSGNLISIWWDKVQRSTRKFNKSYKTSEVVLFLERKKSPALTRPVFWLSLIYLLPLENSSIAENHFSDSLLLFGWENSSFCGNENNPAEMKNWKLPLCLEYWLFWSLLDDILFLK